MKSTILGLLAIGLLAGPIGAQAVTWQVTGGVLTGATDVNVGGTLYDVEFVDGTCIALFDGCDSVADFAFNTVAAADLASWALLDQVMLNVAGIGDFDSSPFLTRGCAGAPNLCLVLTPIALSGSNFAAIAAWNEDSLSNANSTLGGADRVSSSGGPISYDFTLQTGTAFARWTLAGLVSVPEPGTLALLGLGLIGLGVTRRKAA